jgi:HlyD family secretion protein
MDMDRAIDIGVRRRRIGRRAALLALAALAVAALPVLLTRLLRPSVARASVRTAFVESGPVSATLTATGTVLPEVEQVISSPVDARVLRIRKRAGDVLSPGEGIIDLDLSASRLAVQKLDQDLAIKQNQQDKTRLDLEAQLQDLRGQREVKVLELEAQRTRTGRDRDLHGRGFLSRDELSQTELAEARVAAELRKIDTEIDHARKATRTQVQGLDLERASVVRERDEARRVLDLATTRADRKGVLTWTVTEEGAAVKKGDVIARLADLSSFRVEATVSDIHAQRLSAGASVIVQVNESDRLDGVIASIQPAVKDGAMTFAVRLAQPGSPLLRANMRVDVLVVTGRKARALRVLRGPFADGEGSRQVFVVRGDRAVRTAARMGMASATHLEVLGGLEGGDEVIISDMSDHLGQAELLLR